MSFADDIRTANYTREELADLLDLLNDRASVSAVSSSSSTGTISSTSSALVDIADTSLAFTVPSGQTFFLLYACQLGFSHSSTSTRIDFVLDYNSASQTLLPAVSSVSATSGEVNTHTQVWPIIASAGSHTFKMRWQTASGTMYVRRRYARLLRKRLT